MTRRKHMAKKISDQEILLLYEDLIKVFTKHDVVKHSSQLDIDASPIDRRLSFIRERVETERRLIEEISRPGRLMIEHFSLFLEKMDYTIGFIYGDIKTGRGLLANIRVGEWGTITLEIGDVSVTWRDADVGYMFYPDRIIVRPNDSGQDDISFFFSYSFKYDKEQLREFQDVASHEKTLYWHEDLLT